MSDERGDAAIGEVARQMTEGSPADAEAFRRRIVSRIERRAAPGRSWRAAFVLSPIAAALVIAVAAYVLRGRTQPAAPLTIEHQAEQARPIDEPSTGASTQPDPSRAADANRAALPGGARNAGRRPAPGPGIAEPGSVEPTPPLDSIAVARLAVETITPEPIQIDKLETIAPITVAPLDIPDAQRREP
jgi:hypothetical protein